MAGDVGLRVSAPGSIMITGEHAVVYGHPAIVAAIEQRVTVHLTPMDEPVLSIRSEIAEDERVPLERLQATGSYRFVRAAVMALNPKPSHGMHIDITSDIDPTLGLGSSAAVTVAVLAALEGRVSDALHRTALGIVRDLQGRGSGADLAASLWGGCLAYSVDPSGVADVTKLPAPPPMSLFNVGYKTPTADVLAHVAKIRTDQPDMVDAIYERMGKISGDTIALAETGDWASTEVAIGDYQTLMADLGVSDPALDRAVSAARQTNGVIGAKISGSGLGDCVLALGAVPDGFQPVQLAREGVKIHDDA